MSIAREIYWVASDPSIYVQDKVSILKKMKVEVKFVSDLNALAETYPNARLNTVIIEESAIDSKSADLMAKLCMHPEFTGVRFILSIMHAPKGLVKKAISLGFRDVISVNLKSDHWFSRFSIAATGQSGELINPQPQISMRYISAINVPVRIAWMNRSTLWLESRLTPPVGTILILGGSIAEHIGVKHLTLEIIEHSKNHLYFRYSDALLCRWDIPHALHEQKEALYDFLAEQPSISPRKVFIIVRSLDIRKSLLRKLHHPEFQVTIPLNRSNMINEPRYISPDMVIIEDKMASGQHLQSFEAMIANINIEVPILIIGEEIKDPGFVDLVKQRKIHRIEKVSGAISEEIAALLPKSPLSQSSVTFIPKDHKLSFGHVSVPARMIKMHPDAAQLAIAYPLSNYASCGIEAPLFKNVLGREVHFKAFSVKTHDDQDLVEFPYKIDGIFLDLKIEERLKIKEHLLEYYKKKLEQSINFQNLEGIDPEGVLESKIISALPPRAPTQELEVKPEPMSKATVPEAAKLELPSFDFYPNLLFLKIFIRKELLIAGALVLFFGLLVFMISEFGPSEQEAGGFMTEQLKIFKEQQKGKN